MMEASELIERLEKATGPDREIDALLWAHFDNRVVRIAYGEVIARKRDSLDDVRLGFVDPTPLRSNFYGWDGEAYTASIDAALALVERVLPGWKRGFRDHDEVEGDGVCAWLCSPDYSVIHWSAGDVHKTDVTAGMRVTGDAPTFALALCLALLRAALLKAQPTVSPQAQAASDLQPQE